MKRATAIIIALILAAGLANAVSQSIEQGGASNILIITVALIAWSVLMLGMIYAITTWNAKRN